MSKDDIVSAEETTSKETSDTSSDVLPKFRSALSEDY